MFGPHPKKIYVSGPVTVPDIGGDAVKCLLCDIEMTEREYNDHKFHFCKKCGGVWMEEKVFKEMAKIDPMAGRELKCAECGSAMVTRNIEDVEIDVCPFCRTIWLDAGEMEKLTLVDPASGDEKKMSEVLSKDILDVLDDL